MLTGLMAAVAVAGMGVCAAEAPAKDAVKTEAAAKEEAKAVWLNNYSEAVKQAKESGKPILVDFTGSDWCGWCIKLDKEVFSKPAFAEYAAAHLILLKVDFPQKTVLPKEVAEQNDIMAKAYDVEGFPTIVLIKADGEELARTGYQAGGAEKYVKHLEKLLKKAEKEAAKPAAKK